MNARIPHSLVPLVLLALAVPACEERTPADPLVQFSDEGRAEVEIAVNDGGEFEPGCVTVTEGDIVAWRNETAIPNLNVTSLDQSRELYSPNLADEYAVWQHRFDTPGRYEYYDANSGDPGRRVVDAYYGTVTFVGTSASVERAYVCVERANVGAVGDACTSDAACGEDSACECEDGSEACATRRCIVQPLCHGFCCDPALSVFTRCLPGDICDDDNRCVDGCERTADCPVGEVCGPGGECITECREDRECPPDFTCRFSQCVAPESAP